MMSDLCEGHALELWEAADIALDARACLLHYRAVHASHARLHRIHSPLY